MSKTMKRYLDALFRVETIKPEKAGSQWKMRCQLANNLYCIRASVVTGTVMSTVRQVTGTASELVLLQALRFQLQIPI